MKKFFFLFTMIFMVLTACSDFEKELDGFGTPTPSDTIVVIDTVIISDTIVVDDTLVIRTPVYVDVVDGDTLMRDADGGIIRIRPDKFIATLTCQDTVMVSADKPWALMEAQINPQTPMRNYFIGISSWVYNHRTLSAKDSIRGEYRGIPLSLYPYAPCYHEVEEFEEVVTDTTTSRNVHYVLYIRDNVMCAAPQVQGTTTSNIEVKKLFAHKAFRPNATVNGSNIAIICDNTATFNDDVVNYIVTNNFIFNVPEYISVRAKGNTYFFEGSTATVEGKNVIVSFSNRVIADIIFNNTNYKDDKDVPQCEITVKSIKFGEKTAIITFVHDNETVTAEVPIHYNYIIRYELVGNPTHDMWNSVYSTSNGFAINCNNHVVVKEIWADGSEGENSELPYVSTNEWSVEGNKSIIVENLNSVIGVRQEIVDGSVTIGYSKIQFNHSMYAENVSKGTFSYKPAACEAVARYINVISESTAIVEIFHDNKKIGEHELPINITEIILIPGRIIRGNRTDSYETQTSGRVTWDFIHTTVAGVHTVHSKQVENKMFTNHEVVTSFGAMTASDPFAYWYDASGNKHLGTLSATKMDVHNKEAYLILYQNFYKETMYTLGTAEDALNNPYRNPVRAELQKVVKGGKTLWTFDNVTFYRGSED